LQVLQGQVSDATRQVSVVMYDSTPAPLLRWNFQGAYPVRWEGPTLKADQPALAIEMLELTHHGFTVESG
jgi:phage tail-like protein